MKVTLPFRSHCLHSSLSDFNIISEIGYGAFSKVYKAFSRPMNNEVALKIFSMDLLGIEDQLLVLNEIEIHSGLKSPHIVSLFDYFSDNNAAVLVLELADRGNFFTLLKSQKLFASFEIVNIIRQVVEGLYFLHSKSVFFRDLKAENIVIGSNGEFKLCDFGWATKAENTRFRTAKAGTLVYMSPESLAGLLQDEKSDIWALGVLIYEIFFGVEPFKATSIPELQMVLQTQKPDFSTPINAISPLFVSLITRMLSLDPQLRPSAKELLSIDFMGQNQPNYGANSSGFLRFSADKSQVRNMGGSPQPMNRSFAPVFFSPDVRPRNRGGNFLQINGVQGANFNTNSQIINLQVPIQIPQQPTIQLHPIQAPIQVPIQHPIQVPIQVPIQHPIQHLVQHPMQVPMQAPMQSPMHSSIQLLNVQPAPMHVISVQSANSSQIQNVPPALKPKQSIPDMYSTSGSGFHVNLSSGLNHYLIPNTDLESLGPKIPRSLQENMPPYRTHLANGSAKRNQGLRGRGVGRESDSNSFHRTR